MDLTVHQQRALAIAPKPPAALSFFSSAYVIYSAAASKERRKKMYHRLMIGMAATNLVESVCHFWGTWAMPRDFPMSGTAGTEHTCAAQGFLANFGFAVAIYYSSLSLFAVLAVRHNFDEKKLVRYEPWIHAGAFLFPISTGIYAIHKNYYNPSGSWCNTASFPPGCERNGSCIHEVEKAFSNVLLGSIYALYGFATFMMVALYVTVLKREIANQTLVGKRQFMEHARRKKSRMVAWQATLYLVAFYAVYFFSILSHLLQKATGKLLFPLNIVAILFSTLQGFFNMLVYIKLRLKNPKDDGATNQSWQQRHRGMSVVGTVNTISHSVSPQVLHDRTSEPTASQEEQPGTRQASYLRNCEFSIFDGTNISSISPWADFFDDEDVLHDPNGEEDMMNDEDCCNIEEEVSAVTPQPTL
uniref:G-protein coupled receptors family 2 profile 2 domain-containing protein n=1 Tax=Odontella aurita TaxID=265563 RepID=A0A7S4HJF1_9STRA